MGSIDYALMFAYDLPLGDDQEVIGIDAQADGPIGEGRRHAVAVALQMQEAGRRAPLAIFHEAIERPTHRHQAFRLLGSSEERSVGKASVITGRYRWSPHQQKHKNQNRERK